MLSSLKRKCACKHWPGFFLLALLFTVFTPAAHGQQQQVVAVDCGGMDQRVCTSDDGFYHVVYNVSMDTAFGNSGSFYEQVPGPFWFNESQCDLGLSPNGDICDESSNGKWSGHRNIIGKGLNTPWIDFAMKEQRGGIQSDQAINWITIFGTHNSFSNYQDGAFNVQIPGVLDLNLNVDQYFSMTDQLNAGARVIRMDPITYGAFHSDFSGSSVDYKLRMCHQSASIQLETDGECDFTSYGRLFAEGVFELRQWLDNNPGEVVILRLNRTQSQDLPAIDAALKWNLAPAGNPAGSPTDILMPAPSNGTLPGYAVWNPDNQGWPSLRQMRAMNKRLIIMGDNATEFVYPWTWVMNDGYTDAPKFSECYNQPGTLGGVDIRTRNFNMWSYIGEDRSGSNAITATYSPSADGGVGLLNVGDVKTATNCGYGLINVDFLLASQSAPHMSGGCAQVPSSISLGDLGDISLPSKLVTLANDLCVPDFDYRTGIDQYVNQAGLTGQPDSDSPRDVRREAAIWSWEEGEFGDNGPAALSPNGRWQSFQEDVAWPFACAVGQGDPKNPANYQWVITPTDGQWARGPEACQAIGGKFWAPQSALEEQNLISVANPNATPGVFVWINYKSQSNILLEPISPQLSAAPDNTFVIDVTQGQSGAALSPIFQYTGGVGGNLTATPLPTTTSVFSTATVNFSTKNINLAVAPGALDSHGNVLLQPGTYTEDLTVSEVQQVVVDVQSVFGPIPTTEYKPVTQVFSLTVNVAPATTVNVTVDSHPSGEIIYVDNVAVIAPHTFSWIPGSIHSLNANNIVNPPGEKQMFLGWSNGTPAPSFAYTVPSVNSGIEAKFSQYYLLTLTTFGKGTVSANPSSPDGYYLNGAGVTVTATPGTNYYFSGFSGAFQSDQNRINFAMEKPLSFLAKFTPDPATSIQTAGAGISLPAMVDGTAVTVPAQFYWTPGSKHTVAFASPLSPQGGGVQFLFSKWSDGTTSASRTVTASVTPQSVTADFIKQFFVTTSSQPAVGGTVTGQGWYTAGSSVTFTATAANGYRFIDFNGNRALKSPFTDTINAPTIEYAYFRRSDSN